MDAYFGTTHQICLILESHIHILKGLFFLFKRLDKGNSWSHILGYAYLRIIFPSQHPKPFNLLLLLLIPLFSFPPAPHFFSLLSPCPVGSTCLDADVEGVSDGVGRLAPVRRPDQQRVVALVTGQALPCPHRHPTRSALKLQGYMQGGK